MEDFGNYLKKKILSNGEIKYEKDLDKIINREFVKYTNDIKLIEEIFQSQLSYINTKLFSNKKNAVMANIYASRFGDDKVYDYINENPSSWATLIASNFSEEISDFIIGLDNNRIPKNTNEDMYENLIADLTNNKYKNLQNRVKNQDYFIVIDKINEVLGKTDISYDDEFKQFISNAKNSNLTIVEMPKINDSLIHALKNTKVNINYMSKTNMEIVDGINKFEKSNNEFVKQSNEKIKLENKLKEKEEEIKRLKENNDSFKHYINLRKKYGSEKQKLDIQVGNTYKEHNKRITIGNTHTFSGNYRFHKGLYIKPGKKLIIEPGTVLEFGKGALFKSDSEFIYINGKKEDPVKFTGINGDLWQGIKINPQKNDNHIKWENLIIENIEKNKTNNFDGNFELRNINYDITNLFFRNNKIPNFNFDNSNISLINSLLQDNSKIDLDSIDQNLRQFNEKCSINIKVNNLKLTNTNFKGKYAILSKNSIHILNSEFDGNINFQCNNITVNKSKFNNSYDPKIDLKIDPRYIFRPFYEIIIDNCEFNNNRGVDICYGGDVKIYNSKFKNNMNWKKWMNGYISGSNIYLENNNFEYNSLETLSFSNAIYIKNTIKNNNLDELLFVCGKKVKMRDNIIRDNNFGKCIFSFRNRLDKFNLSLGWFSNKFINNKTGSKKAKKYYFPKI